MTRNEAIEKLSTIGHISVSYAEDLYDSFFPKPVVPQYVADWYEGNNDEFEINLFQCIGELVECYDKDSSSKFEDWLMDDDTEAFTILVNMHQFGYEVEKETKYKETKYTVKIKVTNQYLCNDEGHLHFSPGFRTDFTKTELEKSDFGWVFDCEGIEIKEVE